MLCHRVEDVRQNPNAVRAGGHHDARHVCRHPHGFLAADAVLCHRVEDVRQNPNAVRAVGHHDARHVGRHPHGFLAADAVLCHLAADVRQNLNAVRVGGHHDAHHVGRHLHEANVNPHPHAPTVVCSAQRGCCGCVHAQGRGWYCLHLCWSLMRRVY